MIDRMKGRKPQENFSPPVRWRPWQVSAQLFEGLPVRTSCSWVTRVEQAVARSCDPYRDSASVCIYVEALA